MTILLRSLRAVSPLALLAALAVIAGCGDSPASQSASVSAMHVSPADVHWLDQAHQADMAEVTAGQLATSNASTAAIRSVGATLVRQHAAFDSALVAAAIKLKVALVTAPTTDQTIAGDRLSKELGPVFDYDFTATMLAGHQQMIAATEAEIRRGSSPVVIALAQRALPMLEMHMKLLRSVAGSG